MYRERVYYRCYHDTRYEKTREGKVVLENNPGKRFRNTYCPFQLSFKVKKCVVDEEHSCNILLEYKHNHPVNSLEAVSFRSLDQQVKETICTMFESGMSASQAFN